MLLPSFVSDGCTCHLAVPPRFSPRAPTSRSGTLARGKPHNIHVTLVD